MNPDEIGINELRDRLAAAILRVTGTGVYGDPPYVLDVYPGRKTVVYALSSEYYSRTYEIGAELSITLGTETLVDSRTEWLPDFEADFSDEGDTWKGLIFRAGRFSERIVKGRPLEITPDHLRKVVANFSGFVALHIDHNEDSVMAEVLKEFGAGIVRLWTNADATELFAEIKRPTWLAEGFKNFAKKVSVRFSDAWDALVHLSLVKNPRITDAALYSAFSSSADFKPFAVQHPGAAATIAQLASATAAAPDQTPNPMSDHEKMRAYFRGKPEEARKAGINPASFDDKSPAGTDPKVPTGAPTPPPAAAPATGTDPALVRSISEIEARFSKQDDENAALSAYREGLSSFKITVAERESFLRQFAAARSADRAELGASFAADPSKGRHVAALNAEIEKRSPRFSTTSRIPSHDPTLDAANEAPLTAFSESDYDQALGKKVTA